MPGKTQGVPKARPGANFFTLIIAKGTFQAKLCSLLWVMNGLGQGWGVILSGL